MRSTLRPTAQGKGTASPSSIRTERGVRPPGSFSQSARGAPAWTRKLNTRLPPHLEDDVRHVGALAELFAAAAAERLAGEETSGNSGGPTLLLIALATGAALSAPLLGPRPAARRPSRPARSRPRTSSAPAAHDTNEGETPHAHA